MTMYPIDLILRQARGHLLPAPLLVPDGVADLTAYRLRRPLQRPVDGEAAAVLDLEAVRARRSAARVAAARQAGHPSATRL
ncbi:hypothetical protein GCM10011584_16590 [Nocardioides phosphati]|uniref:Uncharacterized protein n=1 Tax=Nocardioides phosphati TaxID=1867775 RepID=A0ABQ2N9V3_9ACTN|nr:hypothetical protein [Nocardioides phosphati]GGO88776.1 hypothetical protein GCM10011584_16590 [Nocardioides phosphati]